LRGLRRKKIIIPFRETLTEFLDAESLRLRADIDKLHTFVELYALFNLKRLQKINDEVYAVTPEVAIEALKLIEKPLTNMLSLMDERLKPLIDVLKEMEFKAYNVITKDDREKIAVKLGKSEKTVRDYLNYLESRGLVSSDSKKPKTYTLLYKLEEIEAKLSRISAKLQSADSLMEKMREEAQNWLNSRLEIKSLEDTDTYKPVGDTYVSTSLGNPISNSVINKNKASLETSSSKDWRNEKSPIPQVDGLFRCPYCEKPTFFGARNDLALHVKKVHPSK